MKKILLIIFSTVSLQVYSQTNIYHPFPDSNAVWNIAWGGAFSPFTEYYSTMIQGDTAIGGLTYHKLVIPYIKIYGDTSSLKPIQYPGYVGCIRQDTSLRQVYYIPSDSTAEQLMFDFSLKVGDTVHAKNSLICGLVTDGDTIYAVDSILTAGSYRKFWRVVKDGADLYGYIEGIGYVFGLRENCFCGRDSPCFFDFCFQQDGSTQYTLYPNSTNCDIISGFGNPTKPNSSSLIIKQYDNTITVKINAPSADISIYNVLGSLIRNYVIYESATFNFNYLDTGVYLYQVNTNDGQHATGKFIIN